MRLKLQGNVESKSSVLSSAAWSEMATPSGYLRREILSPARLVIAQGRDYNTTICCQSGSLGGLTWPGHAQARISSCRAARTDSQMVGKPLTTRVRLTASPSRSQHSTTTVQVQLKHCKRGREQEAAKNAFSLSTACLKHCKQIRDETRHNTASFCIPCVAT